MTTTFTELKEKLTKLDEITLMELLEINSEMLVERFQDEIDEKYEFLLEQLDD